MEGMCDGEGLVDYVKLETGWGGDIAEAALAAG